MESLTAIMKRNRIEAKGIVHYGGEGHELDEYLALGFKRILFVQPDPVKYAKISERVMQAQKLHVMAVHAELGEDTRYVEREYGLTARRDLTTMLIELGTHPKAFNVAVGLLKEDIPAEIIGHFEIAGRYADFEKETQCFERPFLNLWQNPAHGRFANELFQYWFASRYAKRFGLTLRTGPWAGQALFGLNNPHLERPAPVIVEHEQVREKSKLLAQMNDPTSEGERNFCIEGHYQFHTGGYAIKERNEFRDMFSPCVELKRALAAGLAKFHDPANPLLVIHLRRGDYAQYENHPMFYQTPTAVYVDWLKALWPLMHPASPTLYIATDDPATVADFAQFDPRTAADLGVNIAEKFYPDFWMMTQADYLAISNSSFSFAAAMLNKSRGNRLFARPNRHGKLLAFDPWDDEVLLHREEAAALAAPTTEEQCLQIVDDFLAVLDPLKEGTFVEVGLGTFAWYFTHFAKKGYRCEVIEPSPVPALVDACMEYTQVCIRFHALGNSDGKVTFFPGATPDLNSTQPDWWGRKDGAEGQAVDCRRLSSALAEFEGPVACLKIDVEGAEVDVLATLQQLDKYKLPRVIMFEYGGTPRAQGKGGWTPAGISRTRTCISILQNAGYSRCIIVENRRPPVEFNLQENFPADPFAADADYGNVIAILPL